MLLFLHVFSFISNEYDKIKCFKKSVVGWKPEYFSCLWYIVSCEYLTRTHTHTRGNSVAHIQFRSYFGLRFYFTVVKLYLFKIQLVTLQKKLEKD
jgi:hypothetical protein